MTTTNLRRQNRTRRALLPIRDLATHPEPNVRVSQVTVYFGVEERTVAKWIEASLVEAIRLPGKAGWRIRTTSLVAFEQKHGMRPSVTA